MTSTSKVIFQKLNILISFLDKDPEFWREDEDFQNALTIVHELKVVNDHVKQGVALIKEYFGLFTKEEDQLQYLLYSKLSSSTRKCFHTAARRLS